MLPLLLLATLLPSWASPGKTPGFTGPDHTQVDLLRVVEDGPRIYVQARFPDGSNGLFLVDTGANISLLSTETATRLGLAIDADYASVVGLGGVASMDRAVVPSLQFGKVTVADVEVAVGVPGMTKRAGAMELDGLLGNNVWANFTMEIDYPADTLVLHRPGTFLTKRKAAPMVFDGSHIFTPLLLSTTRDPKTDHSVVLRVDTGAGHLSLCGRVAEAFDATWTEGLEPVLGLGASETLPPFRNLQATRQLELDTVQLAGRRLDDIHSARWMNFGGASTCPDGMRGLIGHHLLASHRVVFDFANGKMEMSKSRRRQRKLNGHAVVLEQERAGPSRPDRALYRARLALQLDDFDTANEELARAAEHLPTREKALVLQANVARYQGNVDEALRSLQLLDAGQLVDQSELVGLVNTMLFESRPRDALGIAMEAVDARPDSGWSYVALADALLATGDLEAANDAILEAVERESFPDAHLLRRARIALARGDRDGSTAHIRRLLHLYPMGGEFLWFYALLVDEGASPDTFRNDLDEAMARLHPNRRPFDFLVAANQVVGADGALASALDAGLERDCTPLTKGPAHDNCLAWYWSLARKNPDEALQRIERAIAEAGERSDYLDTLAMVHLARREFPGAVKAADAAARLSPESVYMLWQAERIRDLAEKAP